MTAFSTAYSCCCCGADEAPQPRRAAAGALFTLPNTTTKQLLIHGGRMEAGHILDDLWQATLGAGNVSYLRLWPLQKHELEHKEAAKGPAARKGHSAVAVLDDDPCMVNSLHYMPLHSHHCCLLSAIRAITAPNQDRWLYTVYVCCILWCVLHSTAPSTASNE